MHNKNSCEAGDFMLGSQVDLISKDLVGAAQERALENLEFDTALPLCSFLPLDLFKK